MSGLCWTQDRDRVVAPARLCVAQLLDTRRVRPPDKDRDFEGVCLTCPLSAGSHLPAVAAERHTVNCESLAKHVRGQCFIENHVHHGLLLLIAPPPPPPPSLPFSSLPHVYPAAA